VNLEKLPDLNEITMQCPRCTAVLRPDRVQLAEMQMSSQVDARG
jgi:hypothetical protein